MRKYHSPLWIVLFLFFSAGVFAFLLRGQELDLMMNVLCQAQPIWLAAAAASMALFFCCEARKLQSALRLFCGQAPFGGCLRCALAGFFFSSVTPSASGGQPMQAALMLRQGYPPARSALALLTDFLSFQFAAFLWAGMGTLLHRALLLELAAPVRTLLLTGAGVSLLLTALLCLAICSGRLLPAIWRCLMRLAFRLFPKRAEAWDAWGQAQWSDLRLSTAVLSRRKGTLAELLSVSIIQLGALHSVPFWVCLALGIDTPSFLSVLGMQAVLFFSAAAFPLPGAVGVSEGGFLLLYASLYPRGALESGMVLTRLCAFYLPVALTGVALLLWRAAEGRKASLRLSSFQN